MARRKYMNPLLLTITPETTPTPIVIAGSWETHGEESQFYFNVNSFMKGLEMNEDEANEYIDMIKSQCGDIELAEMAGGDEEITYAEFVAWNDIYGMF